MNKRLLVCTILIILSMLLAPTSSVLAQDQQPPKPQHHPVAQKGGSEGPYSQIQPDADEPGQSGEIEAAAVQELGLLKDKKGLWYHPGSAEDEAVSAEADISAQASADGYGYSYKTLKYNWIDATEGNSPLEFEDDMVYIEPPFEFPFYNETFNWLYISQNGYIQVGDYNWTRRQSPLLEPAAPNDVIAPFWNDLSPLYDDSGVYTKTGEDETGKYIVIEWVNMTDWYGDYWSDEWNTFTFEAILYEDGRIIFQYDEMYHVRYANWYCGSAGIEDWTGTVGKATLKFCTFPKGYRGVQFTRPAAPAARVQVYPLYYGAFGTPGNEAESTFSVYNSGNLDEDVYDFTIKSKWPVTLYGMDYDTWELFPLGDTDGDGKVDTGRVCPDCSMEIIAQVQVPVTAVIGNSLTSTITVASSLKTSRKAIVTLQTTVPAPFAQVYRQDWDHHLEYNSPTTGTLQADPNSESWWAYNPAIATLPNGNVVSVWSDYYYDEATDSYPYEELYYRVNNSQGAFVTGNLPVQNLAGSQDVWDFSGVSAVAPDGSTGITWIHEVYGENENGDPLYLYNVYFAVLNAAGVISYGPVNITQNTEYYSYYDGTGKTFSIPHITATPDNRFVLTWNQRERLPSEYDEDWSFLQDNIYTTILDTAGNTVQGITERTLDRGDVNANHYDDSAYTEPSVTSLTNNRFLLSWAGWEAKKWSRTYKVYYQVFGSDGAPVTKLAAISTGAYSNFGLDAVQMSGGQTILAWARGTKNAWNSKSNIYYIVLNDLTYKKAKGPVPLTNKGAATGSGYVSVTTDDQNHAILTWVDRDNAFGYHMYYALLGKNGTVLTKPAIFKSNYDRWQGYIATNNYGYGNAPYIPLPPQ